MEAVAAGDHVAAQHVILPVLAVADARLVAIDIAQGHILRLEHQWIALLEAESDQILDHFGLTIDHDGRAAGQLRQWDAVALAVELQLDAMVDDALARQPFTGADLRQDVDGALLQDTRPQPLLAVLTAAVLQHHRLDPAALEQLRQRQSGRAGPNDPHLSGLANHASVRSNSAACPCPTPTHRVARP